MIANFVFLCVSFDNSIYKKLHENLLSLAFVNRKSKCPKKQCETFLYEGQLVFMYC